MQDDESSGPSRAPGPAFRAPEGADTVLRGRGEMGALLRAVVKPVDLEVLAKSLRN